MRESLIRMEFFETYYYANVIHNVLEDTMPYLRNLNSWHEDRAIELFLTPFPKWSALHAFAEYIISDLMYETLDDVSLDAVVHNPKADLWIDRALKHHGIATGGFRAWLSEKRISLTDASEDDAFDYHNDLGCTGELDTLLRQLTDEVFYVLFGNRVLLQRLNSYIAGVVGDIEVADLETNQLHLLSKDGVSARAYIPEWARRAVFYRDRGQCAACHCDLSGLISTSSEDHFDHIIPLAQGGINDVTNLQLLCKGCNLRKGHQLLLASSKYQAWYSRDA